MPNALARVILLDGYDESRVACERELRREGYDVIAVAEEDDAVAAVERGPIDVVVLDLPHAEVEEAARALQSAARRQRERRPATLIALLDPSDTRRTRESAHRSGIDYVLLRPCPPRELARHLARLFHATAPGSGKR